MATTKIDGIHLRLYEEIRAHCERFFRKTLPVFKEIERFRMEVEEESDRYLVFFYEQSEPPDPYREECGMGMIVFKKGYKVVVLLPSQLDALSRLRRQKGAPREYAKLYRQRWRVRATGAAKVSVGWSQRPKCRRLLSGPTLQLPRHL